MAGGKHLNVDMLVVFFVVGVEVELALVLARTGCGPTTKWIFTPKEFQSY